MKTLSIIIPAYQAEACVETCIRSVLANNIDLEVLVVNDGSTDGTEAACRRIADQDSRVRVWTKINEGPGAAREYALSHAQGQYVTFADADDYLEPGAYDSLMQQIGGTVDILEFGYQLVHADGSVISYHPMTAESYSGAACGLHYARQKNTTNYLCNKIFRRSLFEGLTYPHLFAGEDAALMAQLFVRAHNCRTIPDVFYNYVMTPDSLCRRPFSVKRMDNIRAYQFINEFYHKNAPDLCFYSRQKICSLAAQLYCECVLTGDPVLLQWRNKLVAEFKNARKNIAMRKLLSHGSAGRRMMLLLFAISPRLCAFVYARRK